MEPKNQESVVLKNKFYPSGLKEKQIYDYYLSIKNNLLNWIGKNNPVGFFLMMEDQSIIVKIDYWFEK